jgi:hypothetical protein
MHAKLPPPILTRAKRGFSSPLMQWMADERAWAEGFLARSRRIVHLDSPGGIGRHRFGPKCWALLCLEEWAGRQGIELR